MADIDSDPDRSRCISFAFAAVAGQVIMEQGWFR
jgi:hypothetical protein